MSSNSTLGDTSFLNSLPLSVESVTDLPVRVVYFAAFVIAAVAYLFSAFSPKSKLPYVNWNGSQFTLQESVASHRNNARSLIAEGFRRFKGPFNIITGAGPRVMLPPEYIEAVNAEPNLSFVKFTEQEFLAKFDTFSNFRNGPPRMFEDAVMKGLTRSLPKFTKPLSDEMTSCLNDTWGNSPEWHTVYPRSDVLSWVARLSCRIFLGEEMTHNKDWLRLSVDYTVNVFQAIDDVKSYPRFLHLFASWVLPKCRKVRADRAQCMAIMNPILKAREQEHAAATREGRKPNVPDDSIEWFRTAARGRQFDAVQIQIGLAIAAIHTTSDLLQQAIYNVCAHPEIIEPLRQEAIEVLSKYGWKKVALTELRLLDSVFKETQRLKPIGMASMHREALADVELPGGIKLKKGETMGISSHRMWNNDVYENAQVFDPYRFWNRRKIPGLENRSLLVSTSNDHTAFSHGKHACPGRFFAANEVKIAMVNLLLKYDIKLEESANIKPLEIGVQMMASPFAKMQVRRRKEEIDLANVVVD